MFYRQKILLALIESFGGQLKSRDLQKYLFLFTQKCQKDKSYEFVPYKYGCFSFQSYADRRNLTETGHLAFGDDWVVNDKCYINQLKREDVQKIQLFKNYYERLSGDDLIREVYRNFPYYAINSQIADRLMSKNELGFIEAERPSQTEPCFFTIGYEGQSFEHYLNRLIRNNVKLLCDVRRNPLSRKYGFSKSTLNDSLKKLDIEYMHMPELGIVSEKRQQLKTQSDYDRLFDEYEETTLKDNKTALQKLCKLVDEYKRVAITCFEAEPCQCHRGRVAIEVTKLQGWGYPIEHI